MKSALRHLSLCILFCAVATIAIAKSKERPDGDYQDGVLVSFWTAAAGSNCSSSGSVKGSVDGSGGVEGSNNSSGSCYNISVRLYTIKEGGNTFVIKHAPENWNRKSVLEDQLPGAKLKVRTEKEKLFIKVRERESPFIVVEAR